MMVIAVVAVVVVVHFSVVDSRGDKRKCHNSFCRLRLLPVLVLRALAVSVLQKRSVVMRQWTCPRSNTMMLRRQMTYR